MMFKHNLVTPVHLKIPVPVPRPRPAFTLKIPVAVPVPIPLLPCPNESLLDYPVIINAYSYTDMLIL